MNLLVVLTLWCVLMYVAAFLFISCLKMVKKGKSKKTHVAPTSPAKDEDTVLSEEEEELAVCTKEKEKTPLTLMASFSTSDSIEASDSVLAQILASLQWLETDNKAVQLCLSALEQSGTLPASSLDSLIVKAKSSSEDESNLEEVDFKDDVSA